MSNQSVIYVKALKETKKMITNEKKTKTKTVEQSRVHKGSPVGWAFVVGRICGSVVSGMKKLSVFTFRPFSQTCG